MRILLTNDDGVNAPGLRVLERIAREFSDDIWIVAPADENSGAGHSLTLSKPVRIREHGHQHYSVTGTPTDSVMIALGVLMKDAKPDIILSGVNRGANLGDDITYSGTVSAAMEGALAGVRSIAMSQVYGREGMGDSVPFSAAEVWGAKVVAPLLETPFEPRTLVNINFPAIAPEAVKGIQVVRQGFHDYSRGSIVKGTDPRGYDYYWFGLHGVEHTSGHDTDLEVVEDGYIAVTPLQLDLTHKPSLVTLAEAYRQI
jgi:5'-nucleotidase